MSATIIDGKAIAGKVQEEVRQGVSQMLAEHGRTPGLATVLVGDNTASATYVRNKKKACAEVGIRSIGRELPGDISQEDLLAVVQELNADPEVDGILVQLPLPKHIDEEAILAAIDIRKDVDGFHPLNIGRLAMKGRDPLFIPCTPYGCLRLLQEAGVNLNGADAVVLGIQRQWIGPLGVLVHLGQQTVRGGPQQQEPVPLVVVRNMGKGPFPVV